MPKKKKSSAASTARPSGCAPPPVTGTSETAPADRGPVPSRASASASSSLAAAAGAVGPGMNKEELLDRLMEMFSHLDPSVVYVMLSECDFKADDAMDSLLVLSDAAKGVSSSNSSGFECVAAPLSDQVNGDEVVTEDYGRNSIAASENIEVSGWDERLDSSIEKELEKYCMNTYYEQSMSFPQFQPFMNRYNSPINQFPSHYVGNQLPQLTQANLNFPLNNVSHQQQTDPNDGEQRGQLSCTLDSKNCEEHLSHHFNSETNIEKRSEDQSELNKFSSEAIERTDHKNTPLEHATGRVAFPTNIRADGTDVWTSQSESHSLSAAISMNLGAIGSKKYSGSDHFGPKYDELSNAVNHQTEYLKNSDISEEAVRRFSGADTNEIWFGSKKERSPENYKLFGECQVFEGTNELLRKNSSLAKKSLENKENVSKHMQQNTTCFPYWFDVGKDCSGEKLPQLTNSKETSYPQYSSSVHFTNTPTVSSVSWNPWAPEFQPMNMAKTFITPVAMSPVKPRTADASTWRRAGALSSPDPLHSVASPCTNTLPSKPCLTPYGVPQLQTYEHQFPQLAHRKTLVTPKLLFLMRGLPGSGKSTLARLLVQQGPNGIILSTDEYFYQNGNYQFNPNLIGQAHQWNQKRAKEAMEKGLSPVIIDNTNTQSWEMKPYITMAFKHNYKVAFREPNTWWKFKPRELERRNVHGVSKEKIKIILAHYERHVTISTVMASLQPTFPEKKAVELYPAENTEAGAINGPTGPATSPDRQDSPCTLISDLSCAEDLSAVKTNIVSPDNLVPHLCSSAHAPSQRRKSETGHDTDNSTKYSEWLSGDNVRKADQTAGLDASNYNFSEPEDEKRKLTIESETEAAESTNPRCIEDSTHDNSPATCSISGQEIRKGKWQSADSTINEREGTPILPDEGESSGNSTSTKMESMVLEQSSNIETISLNFVGDWPVVETPKPQDQRKRRIRKASELSATNENNVDQSGNLESEITSDSLEYATLSLMEQDNVDKTSNESNSCQVSEDGFDDDILSSAAENSTWESSYENGEDPKNPDISEEQISEELSDKHINKKSWQNKMVGKACKLAPTFTSNSPISEEFPEPAPLTLDQVENSIVIPERSRQANSSQTTPDDFAVLWRIEKENTSSAEYKILIGISNGIKPIDLDATAKSINPNVSVPYRVMHDKSTYVDENDFMNSEENLQNLSDCFKSIPFEDLNDLYEKCNRDVEWTTNLLLDSGMKLSNESPTNDQSGSDHDLTSSCVEEKNQVPQTEEIGLSEEARDRSGCEVNRLLAGNTKVVDVSDQSSETNTENDSVECVESCLDIETINPSPDNAREPVNVPEELKSKNGILSNAGLIFNIEYDQFTNYPKEYHEGEEQSELLFKKNSVNNEVVCTKGDESETSNGNNKKEPNNLSECADINETTSILTKELNTYVHSVTENQPSSDVVNNSVQEENGNEMMTIKDGSPNRDGLVLYSDSMQIQSLELCLPPELALQLNDLFGSVGLDPDSLTPEECVVQIDLNLAKIIHQKWKETILERQKQESLSYQLLLEDGGLSENLTWEPEAELEEETPVPSTIQTYDNKQPRRKAGRKVVPLSVSSATATDGMECFPFMDHWSARVPSVSLRDIMTEEMDFQLKQHQCFMNSVLTTKDCATKLKEKRLLEMFPGIDKHFIMDMYKDNNYSFEQTEQFLKSLFDCDLEKTKGITVHDGTHPTELTVSQHKDKAIMTKDIKEFRRERVFQDVEYPDNENYRVEAALHRRKQQDCFSKAAEAYRRDMKAVATYYAQQGHIHGEKMKEANHRAAIKIFNQVNTSLLPQNVLDLHGLHVDEALHYLEEVLFQKINEYQQKGGKSYLSVITGRGRHSQGGIARIKPVVIDYLKRQNFRFTELQPGVVKIKLK